MANEMCDRYTVIQKVNVNSCSRNEGKLSECNIFELLQHEMNPRIYVNTRISMSATTVASLQDTTRA